MSIMENYNTKSGNQLYRTMSGDQKKTKSNAKLNAMFF
jgi:hypothetical protein